MADTEESRQTMIGDDDIVKCAQPEPEPKTKRDRDEDEDEDGDAKAVAKRQCSGFQETMRKLDLDIVRSLAGAPKFEERSLAVVADMATLQSLREWCGFASEVAVGTFHLSDGAAITLNITDAMTTFSSNATEIYKAASVAENASVDDNDAHVRLPLFSHSGRCTAALEELVTTYNTVLEQAKAAAKARAEEEEVAEVVEVDA